MPTAEKQESSSSSTQSSALSKAFSVLQVFTPPGRLLTVSEVSRRSGLPKSTTHRVLAALCEVGAVERDGLSYGISLRMLSIGTCSPEVAVRNAAAPFLLDLHRVVGHTVHLCALRDTEVVYLEKLQALASPRIGTEVGMSLPAHCTSVGKALLAAAESQVVARLLESPLATLTRRSVRDPTALLAELRLVRARGYATDSGEAAPGLGCVARAVSVGSKPVAAVSIGFPDKDYRLGFPQMLSQTVARIERALAAPGGSQLHKRLEVG